MTTSVEQKLIDVITKKGPIGVDQFMTYCLMDPVGGYYRVQEPIGQAGDFITAPEVSQLFGETIAIWIVDLWQRLVPQTGTTLCELGAGRGTLMDDILRTLRKIAPHILDSLSVVIFDANDRLRVLQQKKLAAYQLPIAWCETLQELPPQPTIFIANEFFDALPIQQFFELKGRRVERKIGLNEDGLLAFVGEENFVGAFPVIEYSKARTDLMKVLCHHLSSHQGGALIIDYGSLEPGYGDTLQAVKKHQFCSVFDSPGCVDLTSHVDFYNLRLVAEQFQLQCRAQTQRDFLQRYGIIERAAQLSIGKSTEGQQKIANDVDRLIGEAQMGTLFKALTVQAATRS